MLFYCKLEDLPYISHSYIWNNNRGGDENVQERVDRFVANELWREKFGGSFVSYLDKRKSDHLPILLCVKPRSHAQNKRNKRKLFRIEEMWLREDSCSKIVAKAWE